jgi:hypothetical protein
MKSSRLVTQLRFIVVILLAGVSCIEPYEPPEISGDPNFLVVDGFINGSENSATVLLSRAVAIASEESFAPIVENPGNPIQVSIEAENGNSFILNKTDDGRYFATGLPLDPAMKYRLKISISFDEQYASEYVEIKQTPEIEEVFYVLEENALKIMVNTSDETGNSKYYRWTYDETFEYVSAFYSSVKLSAGGTVVPRPESEQIFRCYKNDGSKDILVGSSKNLVVDVIRNFEIASIPRTSAKIRILYSINVKQMSLTQEGYFYWYNLFKSTESVGGLFDPMPGEVKGNIYSTTDPGETVIGFFSASSVSEKRIFISKNDLPEGYLPYIGTNCELSIIPLEQMPTTPGELLLVGAAYSQPMNGPPVMIGYYTSSPKCIDCRKIFFGETTKPAFWP